MHTTTKQTHTPGPYDIEDASEYLNVPIYKVLKTGNGLRSVIATCADMALCDEHGGTVLANARLIAACPDLLAALKSIRDCTILDAETPELRAQNQNVHIMAITAIAQAEGKD